MPDGMLLVSFAVHSTRSSLLLIDTPYEL